MLKIDDLLASFKKEYIVGLDIGTSSIKMTRFLHSGNEFRLLRSELRKIGRADSDEARQREMLIALRYLFRGAGSEKSKIIVAINCPHTAVKKMVVPCMPKYELQQGIRLHAKNLFHFPVDESLIDYEIADSIVDKGVKKYELVVAACPVNTVNKYLEVLKRAGIKPASFISTSYALQKAAESSRYPSSDNTVKCYIDIGEVHTEFIITQGMRMVFSRKIPVAGNDFTRALTSTLVSDRGRTQLSFDEAENVKCRVGIPAENAPEVFWNKISSTQILSMLHSPLENLVGEIERCFAYYREGSSGQDRLESVILFGGGASLRGLDKYLSDNLGIDVKFGDPFEGLKVEKNAVLDREKTSHCMEIAVGAALSLAKGVNLLPSAIKEQTKKIVRRGTIEVIATTVILVIALLYTGMKIELGNLNKRASAARLELSSLQPQLKKAEVQILAGKVLINEPQWEDVFKELSNLIPDSVRIDELMMENESITIKGVAAAKEGETVISEFVLTLEKGLFNKVKLVSSNNLSEKGGVEFEIKCWIDYEGSR